jgi:hypothetical protein
MRLFMLYSTPEALNQLSEGSVLSDGYPSVISLGIDSHRVAAMLGLAVLVVLDTGRQLTLASATNMMT